MPGLKMFAERRCVVTGGAGFLGTNLLQRLVGLGAHCVSLDAREPVKPLDFVRYVTGDILDDRLVDDLVGDAEFVFALAGKSGAATPVEDARRDYEINCASQLLLLDSVVGHGSRARVVFPGSRLEYGVARYLPIDEQHPVDPTSVYAVHKYLAGRYHMLYSARHDVRTTVVRIANPYGPHPADQGGQYSILNHFIDTAIAGGTITLFGDGGQLRDYVYIDDVIEALLRVALNEETVGRILNLGSGSPASIAVAAETVVRLVGTGRIEHVDWPEEWQAVETGDSYFCVELAKSLLDWQPAYSLERGLAQAIDAARPARDG